MIKSVENPIIKNINGEVVAVLPLTKPTGKIRVKNRNSFKDYGEPFAVRQNPLGLTNYIEWQIGYDLEAKAENANKTSLRNLTFQNYRGTKKFAYELSEIIYYAHQTGLISNDDISTLKEQITRVADDQLFERQKITRSLPIEVEIGGMKFYQMEVSYPLAVHKFGEYDIYAEIINREKQRAIGVQPMLYLCIPITSVQFDENVIGRTLKTKECAEWKIGRPEAKLAIELFRIFGMLSKKHRFDTLAILEMLFPEGEE